MKGKGGLCVLALAFGASIASSACDPATIPPSSGPSGVACAIEVLFDDDDPNGLVSGTGFPPNEPATLTIEGPPDPGTPLVLTQADDTVLRTDIRGVVLYRTFPGRENIGTARMTLSAGGCTASTDVVLDEELFPPACPDTPPAASGVQAAAYEELILVDEPIGYWRFEEEAGSPIATAEVGQPAAIQGNAELGQAGVAGSRAIGLRGEGRIAIDPLELAGDFTIEGWLLLCNDQIDELDGLFATREGDPDVNFFDAAPRFWTGDEDLVFADSGFLTHGRWYHVALVRAAGAITLYVDGTSLGSARFADVLDVAWLGESGGGEASGQLDEFAIYDHALSLDDLAERVAAAR